jgi:hypothetical protein
LHFVGGITSGSEILANGFYAEGGVTGTVLATAVVTIVD